MLVRLLGIRYIANRTHVKAIVARLSNSTEGHLVQSPSNHPSQLEGFKSILEDQVIKKVEVLFSKTASDTKQNADVKGIILKDANGTPLVEKMGNGYNTST